MTAAPSLNARSALVTGGTDGIGKEIARGLALAGHSLSVVGRDVTKGTRAVAEIQRMSGNPKVRFMSADLSLVSNVHRLADEVLRHFPTLHCLVHSAGVVRGRRELTAEGVEMNFAINYLARFALTQLLLPALLTGGRLGQASRILLVSGAARNGKIYLDDVNLTRNFTTLRAVWQFCEANDRFMMELSRRLERNGSKGKVTVVCLKYGVIKTNIRRDFPRWMKWVVPNVIDPLVGQTPVQAAEPALRLLLTPEFEGTTGSLFTMIRRFRPLSYSSADPELGTRLWEVSERLCSVNVPLGSASKVHV